MCAAPSSFDWMVVDWPAPPHVRAGISLRSRGPSQQAFKHFNLAQHVGDDPVIVEANRTILKNELALPAEPCWLEQVHGIDVVEADQQAHVAVADAAFSRQSGAVCVVMTADCLPVLLTNRKGTTVAAAHAGWRGLSAGVLEATLTKAGLDPAETLAWLGPCIGPAVYEVGEEVKQAFLQQAMHDDSAFLANGPGKVLMDMYKLARQRLNALGVKSIYGGSFCTYTQSEQFYSYRREGQTGRMASLIWMEPPA